MEETSMGDVWIFSGTAQYNFVKTPFLTLHGNCESISSVRHKIVHLFNPPFIPCRSCCQLLVFKFIIMIKT